MTVMTVPVWERAKVPDWERAKVQPNVYDGVYKGGKVQTIVFYRYLQ